jgi:hypothetical protein
MCYLYKLDPAAKSVQSPVVYNKTINAIKCCVARLVNLFYKIMAVNRKRLRKVTANAPGRVRTLGYVRFSKVRLS